MGLLRHMFPPIRLILLFPHHLSRHPLQFSLQIWGLRRGWAVRCVCSLLGKLDHNMRNAFGYSQWHILTFRRGCDKWEPSPHTPVFSKRMIPICCPHSKIDGTAPRASSASVLSHRQSGLEEQFGFAFSGVSTSTVFLFYSLFCFFDLVYIFIPRSTSNDSFSYSIDFIDYSAVDFHLYR